MEKKNVLLKYWLKQSDEKWKTTQGLMKLKRYADALFFIHLTLGLDMKAMITLATGKQPPYVHHLPVLAGLSGFQFSEEQLSDLKEITTFNIRARYDDYKYAFYKKATKAYANKYMKIAKELHLWTRKHIQSEM